VRKEGPSSSVTQGGDGPEFRQRFFGDVLRDGLTYVPARDHYHPYPERLKRQGRLAQWALATRGRASNAVKRVAYSVLARRRAGWLDRAARELGATAARLEELEAVYAALSDESSRDLFVKLLEWRVLGPQHVRLPVSPDRYRQGLEQVHRELLREPATVRVKDPYFPTLNRYAVRVEGNELSVETDETCMLNTFVIDQYAYERGPLPVRAELGDMVLDGGGGYGETALYFASRVGQDGEVVCLEMDPRNRRAIERNLRRNPELASRIRLLEAALWERSGATLPYAAGGKMSRFTPRAVSDGGHVETTTLDELRERAGVARLDFLKLDIEGSELPALKGATRTLHDLRPKLAIAVYHRPQDLVEIPLYLHGLGLGYRFFLDHPSAEMDETVLFART
jgi:FkbM family methyltransferase